MTKRRVLNEYQLECLKDHKYVCEGCSLLDPYMQPFWRWLVEQIPLTWAPNAITLAGLIGNIVSTLFLIMYCPNGHGEASWWCYLLCAVCLFVYQSLDAIDGKQARRTNSSSPLGELFDHGCDAMSIVIIIIGTGVATQIGTSPYIFSLVTFITMSVFYTAQWRTYATRVMRFGLLDVTEGQIVVTSLYLFNSIFGVSVWDYEVFLWLRVNRIVWLVTLLFGISILYNFLLVIYKAQEKDAENKNCSTSTVDEMKKNKTLVPTRYIPAIPMFFLLLLGFACCFFSKCHLLENNVVLYHMMFGVVSTKLSCRVLVSYMTKTEMCYLDSIFIGPCLLLVNQLFGVMSETLVLWIVLFFNIANLLQYVNRVCSDICDHLNIYCFKITPPPAAATITTIIASVVPTPAVTTTTNSK